jgi:hypothetical protein
MIGIVVVVVQRRINIKHVPSLADNNTFPGDTPNIFALMQIEDANSKGSCFVEIR